MVASPQDPGRALARLGLPAAEDLWGEGWTLDADGADRPAGGADRPECLPDDLPDEVAGADITFVRTGAVVHALASVFADVAGARRVWAAVADEGFARCFAESVAHEVELPGHLTLLGPVLPPSDFALDRQGRRLVVHRASFSQAEPDRLLPVELDLAAVLTGRVLVLVWAADEDRATAEPGWRRLVQRLVLRGDVILARDGT